MYRYLVRKLVLGLGSTYVVRQTRLDQIHPRQIHNTCRKRLVYNFSTLQIECIVTGERHMQRAGSSGAMPQDPAERVDTPRRGPRVVVPGAG